MAMMLGLVTLLSMLALGFVLGRIWEIRQEMLSKQRRSSPQDDLTRQRRAEDDLIAQEAARRMNVARRWA